MAACLSPLNLPNPRGLTSADRIQVPCGTCLACLCTKRSQWSVRLSEEQLNSSAAHFITLTYDDDHLYTNDCGFPSVTKRDCQLFFKNLRKASQLQGLKYYLASEYGTHQTYRPHYHIILFNFILDPHIYVERCWGNGQIHIGNVTPASIQYVTKYIITKSFVPEGSEKNFSLMSKNLGINYIKKFKKWHLEDPTRNFILSNNGVKLPLPRYFREKIYTKMQRDQQNQDLQDQIFQKEKIQEKKEMHSRYFQNITSKKNQFIINKSVLTQKSKL